MKLDSLKKLYLEELRDLYSAENQLVKALPKMVKAATHPLLKTAFQSHLEETKGQVERLKQLFESHKASPKGKTCLAMKGLVEEASETISEEAEPEVKDAALIAAGQRVEHYEMAGYGTVKAYAKLLKDSVGLELIEATFKEESTADKKLTMLANKVINLAAL